MLSCSHYYSVFTFLRWKNSLSALYSLLSTLCSLSLSVAALLCSALYSLLSIVCCTVCRVDMHPPLYRPHPDCQEFVRLLTQCHEDNSFGKFFGACNGEKKALDMCFKKEKERVAKKNREENLTKRVQRRNWNDEPRPEK